MSDNTFQIYQDSVVTLAGTIILKSSYIANRINERLLQVLEYETDLEKPETWKYYMNLAGQYHPTDTVMRVVSSDNLEEIDFTPENLLIHPNTSRDYQYGTHQYGELLEKYPTQEDVILGILYPVDKAAAIAAQDHKILGYPKNLVEVNEYTLMEELQDWTDLYFKRYYNDQYTISDRFYYPVKLTMYGMNLIPAIMNARLKRHKTIEAHSFYVQQYLASNSNMGVHHPFMNLAQALHFYRNIRYYQRHAGMDGTLNELIDNLMTKRYLPIASYAMMHDTTTQADDIYPAVTFKRKDMTEIASAGAPEYIDVTTMLAKEANVAPDNNQDIAYRSSVINQTFKDSPSNVVQTKVLESSMINYEDAVTYKLEDVQMAHWLYWAGTGRYSAFVNIANPKTTERIVISVKDAYILASLAMFKKFGFDQNEIPLLAAQRVQRDPLPTQADLQSIVDMKYVDDFTVSEVARYVEPIDDMISIDAFYATSRNIWKSANYQRDVISYQEGMHARGETMMLVGRYYQDVAIFLEPEGTTYTQWLSKLSLNFDDFSKSDWDLLFTALVSAALGKTLKTAPSLRNIQSAMAKALLNLSSYTIQVVTQMADDSTVMLDISSVRGGDQDLSAEVKNRLRLGYVEVFDQKVSGSGKGSLPINIFSELLDQEVTAEAKHYLDLYNGPHEPDRGHDVYHAVPLSRMTFTLPTPPDVGNTKLQPVLGMDLYMLLTDDQKAPLFEQ